MNQGNDINVENVTLTNRTDIQNILYQENLNETLRLLSKIRYSNQTTFNLTDL